MVCRQSSHCRSIDHTDVSSRLVRKSGTGQSFFFFVTTLRGLVGEVSELGQSRNVQGGLQSCGEVDGFELHDRVASTVHTMINSKANFWRLV